MWMAWGVVFSRGLACELLDGRNDGVQLGMETYIVLGSLH